MHDINNSLQTDHIVTQTFVQFSIVFMVSLMQKSRELCKILNNSHLADVFLTVSLFVLRILNGLINTHLMFYRKMQHPASAIFEDLWMNKNVKVAEEKIGF